LSFLLYLAAWGILRWRQSRESLFGPAITLAYPLIFAAFIAATFTVGRLRRMVWGGGEHQFSTDARRVQYERGFEILAGNPFGHGIGMGAETLGFTNLAGVLTIDTYYLAIALEYGVIGFLHLLRHPVDRDRGNPAELCMRRRGLTGSRPARSACHRNDRFPGHQIRVQPRRKPRTHLHDAGRDARFDRSAYPIVASGGHEIAVPLAPISIWAGCFINLSRRYCPVPATSAYGRRDHATRLLKVIGEAAQELARLGTQGRTPETSLTDTARQILWARRMRGRFFPPGLFREPAGIWYWTCSWLKQKAAKLVFRARASRREFPLLRLFGVSQSLSNTT
jgi:hypothetical protein